MIRHAALPALISAVTPVIAAAMIPVRLERQKIIPVPMLLRPSVDHVVTGVKAVRPVQVPLIPVLMPRLPNAEVVITALILAVPERKAALPAQVIMYQRGFLLPNAVPAVMNADIILIVPQQIKIVIMVVHIQTLAENAPAVIPVPTAALQDQHMFLAPADRRKRLSGQLNAETLVINVPLTTVVLTAAILLAPMTQKFVTLLRLHAKTTEEKAVVHINYTVE